MVGCSIAPLTSGGMCSPAARWVEMYWLWCARHVHIDVHRKHKQVRSRGGVLKDFSFFFFEESRRVMSTRMNFFCCLSLSFFLDSVLTKKNSFHPAVSCSSLSFVFTLSFIPAIASPVSVSQFQFGSLLFTHDVRVLALFPPGSGSGRKPWFLHTLWYPLLTNYWLFMTRLSLTLSGTFSLFFWPRLFGVFLIVVRFLTGPSVFSSPPPLRSWGQLQLLLLGFGEWTLQLGSHLWEKWNNCIKNTRPQHVELSLSEGKHRAAG